MEFLEFLEFSDFLEFLEFSEFLEFPKIQDHGSRRFGIFEFWNLVLLFILVHTLSLNVEQIALMIASLQVLWLQVAATEKHF